LINQLFYSFAFVKKAEFISKEKGAEEMKALLGDDFMEVFENNPIPYSIDVFLKADYFASDSITKIKADINKCEGVKELVYQESLVDTISGNMKRAGVIFSSIIALLAFVSIVLINNTVRINIFAKRETIRTMKIVGAKRSYIRSPFMKKAFYQGLISGLISIVVLSGLVYYLGEEFTALFMIINIEYIIFVLLAVLLLGILICMLSTLSVVNKIISTPSDELFY
jgi:cell division transport system permease protein